jgi:hypothetical protein
MPRQFAEDYGTPLHAVGMTLIAQACSFSKPFQHDDFDYLRRATRQITISTRCDIHWLTIRYQIGYLTTRAEEERLNLELRKLLYESRAYAISDHLHRIWFAYDFITRNVSYDTSLQNSSAYDAMMKNSAICEGCASLLYRLLSRLGVRARIITGTSRDVPHAWNIVRINGSWYNADVTWDLGRGRGLRKRYRYCLVGESLFEDHIRDSEFESAEFVSSHQMSTENYVS